MENKKIKKFLKKYYKDRAFCPRCFIEDNYSETEVYYYPKDDSDETLSNFKDENSCTCYSCGNTHMRHKRRDKITAIRQTNKWA